MSVDFSNTLIVAVSATALFDLSESERFFQQALTEDPETAIDKFRSYMIERENDPLQTGTGYPLIKALLNLNNHCAAHDKGEGIAAPMVEVVIMSKTAQIPVFKY